jgi:hypothetical protein
MKDKTCEVCQYWYKNGPIKYYHFCTKEKDRFMEFHNIGTTEIMSKMKIYFPLTHFKQICPDFKLGVN